MIARLAALALLAVSLGGCMQTLSGSVAGGESKVFERPPYVVLGKTRYDQGWIDSQVEGGVASFGWKRPAPRPASLDAPAARKAKAAAPVKKRDVLKRTKDRVVHPFTKPVAAVVESPPLAVIVPAAPPAPRDPVDELLHPNGGK